MVDAFYQLLDADERARSERFALERVRRQFVVGRGFLRQALARYLDIDPRSVRFSYGNFGKPLLAEGGLAFNLTHSDERALLGVTHRRPGRRSRASESDAGPGRDRPPLLFARRGGGFERG